MLFIDRIFKNPRQRKLKDMSTGEIHTFEIQDDPDNIEENGTPVNAQNLNQLATKEELNTIIESGSNANGSWIKLPDGTMIVTQKVTYTGLIGTSWQGHYISSIITPLNYPIPFLSVLSSVLTLETSLYNTWLMTNGASNITRAQTYYIISPERTTTASTWTTNIIAIGKWK